MTYADFSLSRVVKQFQLTLDEQHDLFRDVAEVAPSELLRATLANGVPVALALATEKARSELIIAPILMEVYVRKERRVGLFSGVEFSVDAAQGLTGICDFLLSREAELYFVRAPVLAVVEAKNEDFRKGLGQCAAEMVAARLFNQQEGTTVASLYGAVTTGNLWRFLRLEGDRLDIDVQEYHVEHVDKILGILLSILS